MGDTEQMARTEQIHIAYDGAALQQHTMDVRELAPALLAFSELLQRSNALLNDGRAQIRVEVKASFKEGSFGIDLQVVQSLGQWLHSLVNDPLVADAKQLIEVLLLGHGGRKSVLYLIRKLRGRKLETLELLPGGNGTLIIDGEHAAVESRVLQLLRDAEVRQCFEKLIAKPLESEGVDVFAIVDKKTERLLERVDKEDARYFRAPPKAEEAETVDEYDTRVQVLSVTFTDGNKWRFSEGETPFNAAITHEDFLRRVDLGEEKFGKGDVLTVRIRRRQFMLGEQLRTEKTIVEVYSHYANPPQQRLPLPPAG